MRVFALVRRIIHQFLRDKRTLALMYVAPLLILWLVSLIFNGATYHPKIGVAGVPAPLVSNLKSQGAVIQTYPSPGAAEAAVKAEKIDASVSVVSGTPHVLLEGSDPSKNKAILLALQRAMQPAALPLGSAPVVRYLYGSADMSGFDNFGPVLLGVFAFFFVFVISGVAFLRERSSGTLERMLTTPLRRWEVVAGYVIGFGLFTTVQVCLLTWFAVKVLGMMMVGGLFDLLLTTFMLSLTALTLGTFFSAFANSEFQMLQFIPIVVVPQVFFSGLFSLDSIAPWLRGLSRVMPLYYGADALRNIMIRGKGIADIYPDLLVLLGLSMCFALANVIALRKYRKI